jgi:arabinan endo-1,5-alpha-L-arabinosidase
METNSWTIQGNLSIPASPDYNLIDPNLLVVSLNSTSSDPTYLLSFGSYWQDIFQIELENPLKVGNSPPVHLELNQTTGLPLGENPSEGSFQFRWTPGNQTFYYLFFSSGYCCTPDFQIPTGEEYKIMVCRSDGPSGPFFDQQGRSCLSDNGGTLIYGSQYDTDRGIVYAPGGEGVMYDENVDGGSVILYYHYS